MGTHWGHAAKGRIVSNIGVEIAQGVEELKEVADSATLCKGRGENHPPQIGCVDAVDLRAVGCAAKAPLVFVVGAILVAIPRRVRAIPRERAISRVRARSGAAE